MDARCAREENVPCFIVQSDIYCILSKVNNLALGPLALSRRCDVKVQMCLGQAGGRTANRLCSVGLRLFRWVCQFRLFRNVGDVSDYEVRHQVLHHHERQLELDGARRIAEDEQPERRELQQRADPVRGDFRARDIEHLQSVELVAAQPVQAPVVELFHILQRQESQLVQATDVLEALVVQRHVITYYGIDQILWIVLRRQIEVSVAVGNDPLVGSGEAEMSEAEELVRKC